MPRRQHAKKVIQPAQAAEPAEAAPPPHVGCRVWWAYKHPKGLDPLDVAHGLLVTLPDDLNALIAYVPPNADRIGAEEIDVAARVAAWSGAIDHVTHVGRRVCDLRECGRWWSREQTPPFLYELRVVPAEGTLASRRMPLPTELDPFCPIRLAKEVEKFAQLRWPDACRDVLKYNAVALSERQDENGDGCDGDMRTAVVRRIDWPVYDWPAQVNKELAAAREAAAKSPAPPLKLILPHRAA